ncbi:hypothetical protein GCM10027598_40350 [Amycolatopsis oliviviridis]|uniref:Uncharacterized protein n=1 Tax=Amycolatopsis oliviviridis TaxID=1471590 RepID=A0ABQ3LCQ8_9PSEU|nr:hypothetical protein GCM10017790_21490 [Amycolatopsis oliviviridis]
MAMAAPAYREIPLRTNKTGAGTLGSRRRTTAITTPAWCLTWEKAVQRGVFSYVA